MAIDKFFSLTSLYEVIVQNNGYRRTASWELTLVRYFKMQLCHRARSPGKRMAQFTAQMNKTGLKMLPPYLIIMLVLL